VSAPPEFRVFTASVLEPSKTCSLSLSPCLWICSFQALACPKSAVDLLSVAANLTTHRTHVSFPVSSLLPCHFNEDPRSPTGSFTLLSKAATPTGKGLTPSLSQQRFILEFGSKNVFFLENQWWNWQMVWDLWLSADLVGFGDSSTKGVLSDEVFVGGMDVNLSCGQLHAQKDNEDE
jgi:hypothetical protein